jgi:hypothetical protein
MVLVVTFLVGVVMFPFSLHSRYELLRDGSVMAYNWKNEPMDYPLGWIESVELEVYRSGGKIKDYLPRFQIHLRDGEVCNFPLRTLGDDWAQALQTAGELKRLYGARLEIMDAGKLRWVVWDGGLTAAEEKLLYELFEAELP